MARRFNLKRLLVEGPKGLREWLELVGSIGVTVGLVSGAFFFFFPGCRPKAACEGSLSAILSDPTVDRSVSYAGWRRLTGDEAGRPTHERLRQRGKVIGFDLDTGGFRGKELRLTWTMLTAQGEPVGNLVNQLAFTAVPEECLDRGRRTLWAGPIPQAGSKYLVEIKLVDPNGNELDSIRTPPFAGL